MRNLSWKLGRVGKTECSGTCSQSNNIDELNKVLLEACINYRNHKIQGRSQTVRNNPPLIATTSNHCLLLSSIPVKAYLCVLGKIVVQFDRNRYSVPVHLVGRQVTVKAFGNHLECYHDGVMVAKHSRCYGKGETTFCLEHYLPLLEKKPRAVFHAKPVRRSEAAALLAWGKTFPGRAKDMLNFLNSALHMELTVYWL